ncbi:signal peptidase I SipW [Fictibacillus halophilus]|uniref:signal peptidase I SipW n=1 Tax=Fictibacillus halophilus TaxID=1610490 RepID=UPI001CFAB25E|nr:signal peptidase I [Fictibacillus halophilus]
MIIVKKWVSNIVTTILFLTLISTAFVVISSKASGGEPSVMGYQLKTVLSGSMEPGIQTGSIIAIKPGGDMTRFKKGDVLTFKESEDKLITHRVLEVKGTGENTQYITKGDNNDAADLSPVLAANVVGEYNGFTIPYIGYLLNTAQSKMGSALLLILPGILLLLYSAVTIWKAIKEVEVPKETTTTSN